MAEALETAARLSKVIGARPAGTEEEQQASFFIEETMQNAGLKTTVEEFNCNPNYELPRLICCVVSVVLAILALFLQLLVIPAIVVTAITALLYVLEAIGVAPLGNIAKRGISQNVVAKYIPGSPLANAQSQDVSEPTANETIALNSDENDANTDASLGLRETRGRNGRTNKAGTRKDRRGEGRVSRESRRSVKRKIIIFARYDSGRVCRELSAPFFGVLNIIRWAEIAGMVLIPIMLLIKAIVGDVSSAAILLNILLVICVVVALLPIVRFVFHQTAPYSDGANNNASGVAVMADVAARIAATKQVQTSTSEKAASLPDSISNADENGEVLTRQDVEEALSQQGEAIETNVVMHGEEALLADGAIPPETQLTYSDGENKPEEETKSQVAFWSGVANNTSQPAMVGQLQTNVRDANANKAVPDWFKRGKEAAQARKGTTEETSPDAVGVRSRFSDALEAAAGKSANSIQNFEARDAVRVGVSSSMMAAQPASRHQGVDAVFGQTNIQPIVQNENPAATQAPTERAQVATLQQAVQTEVTPASVPASNDVAQTPEQQAQTSTDVARAVQQMQQAQQQQAAEQAKQAAEKVAVADRTISFIPVASDISQNGGGATEEAEPDKIGMKTASDILEEAAIKTDSMAPVKGGSRKKREIALPSLTGALGKVVSAQQDAPLAEDAERAAGEGRTALKRKQQEQQNRLAEMLPSTDSQSLENTPARESVIVKSRTAKPSTAKSSKAESTIAPATPDPARPRVTVNAKGETKPSTTSQFEAIGETLITDMVKDDIIVEDVDDSAYVENMTSTGAMAGPGYVSMPKSRASRLKNVFGRKKKTDETSFSEAVGISENFDAREVGTARGSWESFQNESADFNSKPIDNDEIIHDDDRDSQRYVSKSRNLRRSSETDIWESADEWDDWNGGAFSLEEMLASEANNHANAYFDDEESNAEEPKAFPTEVWFVALGAELANNAGIKSFLAEHEDELRGAVVIELEAMGAGNLCQIDTEGSIKKKKASSRMKRFVTKAGSALGMHINSEKMCWRDSASYFAAEKGLQTIHLAGIKDAKPCYMGESDDVLDNLDDEIMQQNSNFVYELLRTI